MSDYDYDLFVIGAGSGGVRASRISAGYGAKVAVAEEGALGGTCVNVGCIPKKLLVYASHFAEDFEDARSGYGFSLGEAGFDWPTLIRNKDKEISRLNAVHQRMLDAAGVEILEGRAMVDGPNAVRMGEQRYTARHILVATGGRPSVPTIPGAELGITSDDAFYLESLPERALVVGGGYIAVEFAGIWNGLGSEVIQLYRGPHFLRGFDDDLRTTLAEEMRKKGVDLRFNLNATGVEKRASGVRVCLTDGDEIEADLVLFATGRHPNTQGLGLEEAGVMLNDKGAVAVDEYSRSSVPSIHAIGDATDRIALTPVALHEAMCLAATLFDGRPTAPDHNDVASAVFSQPSLASVGLPEAQARTRYRKIDCYTSGFRALKHTLTGRDEKSFMKLVVDRESDRVVGVHVLGPDAAEVVQGFAVALKCGATKAQFDATIGIHPTAAEELVTMREPVPEE